MKIVTLSIVTGSAACNASCPFCVSKMTVPHGTPLGKAPEVNWRNLDKAVKLAWIGNCTTVLFTGKGEPTLFPEQITSMLLGEHIEALGKRTKLILTEFPFIEIQTNGIPIWTLRKKFKTHLADWYEGGVTTIAISVVHWDPEINRKIYTPKHKKYPVDLKNLIDLLHENNFNVRLTTVMIKGGLDSPEQMEGMVDWAREHHVEQLTFRPVNKPQAGRSRDDPTFDWVSENCISGEMTGHCLYWLRTHGVKLMEMPHGAVVYDVDGQNVCMTDCLSHQVVKDDMRQLIFYPSGRLTYDWQFEGAVLL